MITTTINFFLFIIINNNIIITIIYIYFIFYILYFIFIYICICIYVYIYIYIFFFFFLNYYFKFFFLDLMIYFSDLDSFLEEKAVNGTTVSLSRLSSLNPKSSFAEELVVAAAVADCRVVLSDLDSGLGELR